MVTAPTVPVPTLAVHKWSGGGQVTRRQFGMGGAAALALTACGPEGGGGPASEGGEREVGHAMGTTSVPDRAERVVALDSLVLDTVIALEAPLVGGAHAGSVDTLPVYLGDEVTEADVVGSIAEPSVEAIASLGPDLILGTKLRHEDIYDQLSEIAPTVFVAEPAIDWQDNVLLIGEALGRADRSEEVLGEMLAEAADTGLLVGAQDLTVHVLRRLDTGVRLHGPGTFSGSLLGEVGFTVPDMEWDENDMVELSFEHLDRVTADVVFVTDDTDLDDDLLSGIPAVADGAAYGVNDRTWISGIGIVGAHEIIADVRESLA